MSQAWGVSYHTLAFLQQWVRQLPAEVMHARPLLCYASSVLLFQVAPVSTAYGWLDAAGAILTTALDPQTHADALPTMLPSQMQQEQQDLFGAMLGLRAILRTLEGDGWSALAICEQALTLTDNVIPRSQIVATQALAWYISAANDAVAAVQSAFQAVSLAQDSGIAALALNTIGAAITYTVGTGQLHEAQCLTQQAI